MQSPSHHDSRVCQWREETAEGKHHSVSRRQTQLGFSAFLMLTVQEERWDGRQTLTLVQSFQSVCISSWGHPRSRCFLKKGENTRLKTVLFPRQCKRQCYLHPGSPSKDRTLHRPALQARRHLQTFKTCKSLEATCMAFIAEPRLKRSSSLGRKSLHRQHC